MNRKPFYKQIGSGDLFQTPVPFVWSFERGLFSIIFQKIWARFSKRLGTRESEILLRITLHNQDISLQLIPLFSRSEIRRNLKARHRRKKVGEKRFKMDHFDPSDWTQILVFRLGPEGPEGGRGKGQEVICPNASRMRIFGFCHFGELKLVGSAYFFRFKDGIFFRWCVSFQKNLTLPRWQKYLFCTYADSEIFSRKVKNNHYIFPSFLIVASAPFSPMAHWLYYKTDWIQVSDTGRSYGFPFFQILYFNATKNTFEVAMLAMDPDTCSFWLPVPGVVVVAFFVLTQS